jgi:hypothetical protein
MGPISSDPRRKQTPLKHQRRIERNAGRVPAAEDFSILSDIPLYHNPEKDL